MSEEKTQINDINRSLYDFRYEEREEDFYRIEDGLTKEIVEKQGLSVISDEGALKEICQKVVDANPSQVELYRGGRDKLFGFFVGQVMKETQGRANPQTLNKLLKEALDK